MQKKEKLGTSNVVKQFPRNIFKYARSLRRAVDYFFEGRSQRESKCFWQYILRVMHPMMFK